MAIAKLVKSALLKPNTKYFYTAPTYKQAKMIAWEMLLEFTRTLPNELVHKVNESELYVMIGNNSRIDIKGADDPDRLRGVGLDGCVLDEYADIKENVWKDIIQPALGDRKGWCWFIGTPRGFNHFWSLYESVPEKQGWSRFHFTSYDNPHFSKDEIDRIRKETNEDTFAQEYLAEFRRFEGLVYREFDPDNHVMDNDDRPIRFQKVIAGVDFGFKNPCSVMVIGCESNGRYWIVDEWYEVGKVTDELIDQCKSFHARYGIGSWYPDPAEPDRILEMRRAGLNCKTVNKDLVSGIARVRELFKANRINVIRNCRNTMIELGTYRYPEKKDELNYKEDPIKDMDHLMDAMRYALYTYDPSDLVKSADTVKYHGYRNKR
jgi:PBSX family phage terminase large subunit